MKQTEVKKVVRDSYARVAKQGNSCSMSQNSCCGSSAAQTISKEIGYSEDEMKSAPEGANLGLGCGNPLALASLKEGDIVLDLGSGGGFDCFLAASRVGKTGKVIGVDMTPEMVQLARQNAERGHYQNVEFRLGEIEDLPVADNSIDVIISNCVINLSPDKSKVFKEAFRLLKPGGRLMVSDIVLLRPIPDQIRDSVMAYVGCIGGAMMKTAYLDTITAAGFTDVKVAGETAIRLDTMINDPTVSALIQSIGIPMDVVQNLLNAASSVQVSGIKPANL